MWSFDCLSYFGLGAKHLIKLILFSYTKRIQMNYTLNILWLICCPCSRCTIQLQPASLLVYSTVNISRHIPVLSVLYTHSSQHYPFVKPQVRGGGRRGGPGVSSYQKNSVINTLLHLLYLSTSHPLHENTLSVLKVYEQKLKLQP